MKNRSGIIALIVILSLLVIGLTVGMIILINRDSDFNFVFSFNNTNSSLVESMEANSKDVNSIEIRTVSTDIEIKESNKVKVEYYSNSEKNPKIVKDNNSIVLDETKYDTSCIGFCNVNRKVIVYLPISYNGDLNVDTTSGDITATSDLNRIRINTTSGDIKLLNVNSSSIKTTSGDININSIYKKVYIKTTSGDIDIKELDIKYNSQIKSISGDVDVNDNNSNCYVETSTTSGDIDVANSNRKSDLVLKIRTTSGDISVN